MAMSKEEKNARARARYAQKKAEYAAANFPTVKHGVHYGEKRGKIGPPRPKGLKGYHRNTTPQKEYGVLFGQIGPALPPRKKRKKKAPVVVAKKAAPPMVRKAVKRVAAKAPAKKRAAKKA